MKNIILATAAIASIGIMGGLTSVAHADDNDRRRCGNVPIADWMSEGDLRNRITPLGIEVREIDIDDGCYEVEARNKDGRKVEIHFNPQTGEQVWIDGDDD
jgi:hypothetical protein